MPALEARVAARPRHAKWVPIAIGLLFAIYPALVWLGLAHERPRTVALLLLVVMLPVLVVLWRRTGAAGLGMVLAPALTVGAIALAAASDDASWLYAEPVVISAALLVAFGVTLRRGAMPMIERFARLQEPDLNEPKQRWCRLWTWIWCGFFVVNGTTSWLLAALAPMSWWVCFTTTIVYVLMGVLFATEWTLRRRRFANG